MTERPTVEHTPWQRNGHYIETVSPPLGGHCQLTICDIYGEGDTIKDTGDFIVKAVNCYADLVAALERTQDSLIAALALLKLNGIDVDASTPSISAPLTAATAALAKAKEVK